MDNSIKYQVFESCWKESLGWTFELINSLKEAYLGKGKITDLEKSRTVLINSKNRLAKKKNQVNLNLRQISMHVKPVRNFITSSQNLLNSTEVNLSKNSMRVYKPFDFFDSLESEDLTIWELNRNIEIVKRNIENNWVAFNQNYGRMLIKLKINGYDIKFQDYE